MKKLTAILVVFLLGISVFAEPYVDSDDWCFYDNSDGLEYECLTFRYRDDEGNIYRINYWPTTKPCLEECVGEMLKNDWTLANREVLSEASPVLAIVLKNFGWAYVFDESDEEFYLSFAATKDLSLVLCKLVLSE